MNVTHRGDGRQASGVVEALLTQKTFDRGQVAWLMQQAMRWGREFGEEIGFQAGHAAGYDTCLAEWNESAAAAVSSFTGQDVVDGQARKWLREQHDAMARTPRPTDYIGGAVAWDDKPVPLDRGRLELRVAA